jgi:hypothetical protein
MEPKATQETSSTPAAALVAPAALHVPLAKPAHAAPQAEAELKEVREPVPPPEHARFAEELHQYLREYIRAADQKAAFFFASATAVLAFLHSQRTAARWLKTPTSWSLGDTLAFLAMTGLATAAAVFLAVVFPRLKGSKRSIIYFGGIAEYETAAEYANDIARHQASDLIQAKLHHAHALASICHRKYRTLLAGFWIGAVGAGATLLYLLIG